MKDALIIGGGIAGTVLSYQLHTKGWTFDLVDQTQAFTASKVASGLYNPLVLKRRRVVWKAPEMLALLDDFYNNMEVVCAGSFFDDKPVWEVLHDPGVENDWIALSDLPKFEPIIGNVLSNSNPAVVAHKLGEVAGSGRVDVPKMINDWGTFLAKEESYYQESVAVNDIQWTGSAWQWKGKEYHQIIWTIGFDAEHPHFPDLPFSPTKGEVLIVHAPNLKLDHILHGGVFIMPLGNDLYKVGATYSWDPLDTIPTQAGKEHLIKEWNKLVNVSCEVIKHVAGIRPNVKDRKPLLGKSITAENSYIFNGLGSRGILMAPWLSQMMEQFIFKNTPLLKEVDISRFS